MCGVFGISAPGRDVAHGARVETTPEWFCEAVWAGDFDEGDFDLTDQIFGSGARFRGDKLIFVSAGATTDRLISMRLGERWIVSNSLACVLERADATSGRVEHFERSRPGARQGHLEAKIRLEWNPAQDAQPDSRRQRPAQRYPARRRCLASSNRGTGRQRVARRG